MAATITVLPHPSTYSHHGQAKHQNANKTWPRRGCKRKETDVKCSEKTTAPLLERESQTAKCKNQERLKSWVPKEGEITEGPVTKLIISRSPADSSSDGSSHHTGFGKEQKSKEGTVTKVNESSADPSTDDASLYTSFKEEHKIKEGTVPRVIIFQSPTDSSTDGASHLTGFEEEQKSSEGTVTSIIISRSLADSSTDGASHPTEFEEEQNYKESVQSKEETRTNDVSPKVDLILFSKSSSTPVLQDLLRFKRKLSLGKNTESLQRSSVNYHFFEVKYFPHFEYIYTQTWDCKKRVEKVQNVETLGKGLPRDVIIKIGIVGDFSKDDLHLISKSTGKRTISKDQHIWEAQPLICFQNDLSPQSKLKKYILRQEKACHKVLIKPSTFCNDTDESVYSIISVVRNRAQIQEAITICLEEPIHRMLEKLLKDLKTAGLNKIQKLGIAAEIEAIRKQMTLENSRDLSAAPVLQNEGTESVIPENIKAYLFRRPDVHSFGIWRNSSFKVLVKKTDESELKSELTKVNPTFFETYNLEVEKGKLENKHTNMMQGDSIHAKIRNEDGNYCKGTLGGFVTKSDEEGKKYALTCNHIFPEVDEPAYNHDLENIGSCLFTTREQSCDFAAIEIEQSFVDKCDVCVTREDRKKTNARVYAESIGNIGLVHKIGATTDVTKGSILSPEWHEQVLGSNWVSTFLVQGIGENFSEEGDSGSLVFSRPRNVQQNCVDVMGMVYGNKLTVYDTDEENEHVENNSNEGEIAASNVQDAANISGCFRIHTALELFKENQGEDFDVKFKDDLSSSSPSSSLSDDLI